MLTRHFRSPPSSKTSPPHSLPVRGIHDICGCRIHNAAHPRPPHPHRLPNNLLLYDVYKPHCEQTFETFHTQRDGCYGFILRGRDVVCVSGVTTADILLVVWPMCAGVYRLALLRCMRKNKGKEGDRIEEIDGEEKTL